MSEVRWNDSAGPSGPDATCQSGVTQGSGRGQAGVRQGRAMEVETGFEPVYTALQAVASPLGHSTRRRDGQRPSPCSERTTGFEPATLTLAR